MGSRWSACFTIFSDAISGEQTWYAYWLLRFTREYFVDTLDWWCRRYTSRRHCAHVVDATRQC